MTTTSSSSDLHALVLAIVEQPGSKTARAELYRHLKPARLYLAAHSLPLSVVGGPQAKPLADVTKIPLYTAVGADGSKALLAYLDTETLKAQCPESFIVELTGLEVLNLVLGDEQFSALVLKTAQGWAGIPRTDVRRLVKGYARD